MIRPSLRRVPSTLALGAALSITTFAACAGTPGRAVELVLASEPRSATTFTTSTGWTVTLNEARLAIEAVYVYPPDDAMAALQRALVPVAHAHGGHDPLTGTAVRAELLEPFTLDALAASEIGVLHGTAGAASELSLVLGAAGDDTHGHHAWARGEAIRDGITIAFEGGIDVDPTSLAVLIEHVVIEGSPTLDDRGRLVIDVHADRWLDQAHFDRLPVDDAGHASFDSTDQPGVALSLGARAVTTYGARYEPETGAER